LKSAYLRNRIKKIILCGAKMAVIEKGLTGAQIFMESLRSEGIDTIFGYPGAIILSIYEELYKSNDIKHYLVRHEQAAIHAAEGYARVSGKCGVALVTSGPGATNTITGLANAYLDGYPLVVFTGQVDSNLIGNDAFQEADVIGLTRSCTKHNFLVTDVNDLARKIKEAFYIAKTGKPGPVVVDIPKNILETKTTESFNGEMNLAGYNPTSEADRYKINLAADYLSNAKKAVIISGGGVLTSGAEGLLTALAQELNIPVTTTMMGIGTYTKDDETNLGMLGVLGNYWANEAISECDLLLAVGTRLSDRIVAPIKNCAKKGAKIIHIDIDPCSLSKMVKADVEIACDAKLAIKKIIEELRTRTQSVSKEERQDWINHISEKKAKRFIPEVPSDKLHAHKVLEKIYQYTAKYNPIVATEVGQHQIWTMQNFKFNSPRKLLTSGGLGTMGFGFPAAMGACLADKNSLVLDISGDGSIQMNVQELATCVEYKLPVKVMILNNGYLGMVRQWQEKFYEGHYSGTKVTSPDFVKLAEAYGAKGIRVEREEEIENAINEAIAYDGPVFVDFIVESFDFAYPYVPKQD
jgi:acetolactate synthase-1/2/3 large subunit